MTISPTDRPVVLEQREKDFLDLYKDIREQLGQTELWNGRMFRLAKLTAGDAALTLAFELGHFFDSLACQYSLEHETRLALAKSKARTLLRPRETPARDRLSSSQELIESFCQRRVSRIGISNLLLFRTTNDTYRPGIRARGALSLGHVGDFDPISSGSFDVSTADPSIDFSLRYKVLKEVYEELFGGREVEKEMTGLEPDFFFSVEPIKDLKDMLDDDRAIFHVTGFCIDLIRIIPEITTVTVIRDGSYYSKYKKQFRLNFEYSGEPFYCEIPRDIPDVDEYLKNEFPSNPARPRGEKGFDPAKWTLPGGFCFYQGLKHAATSRIL